MGDFWMRFGWLALEFREGYWLITNIVTGVYGKGCCSGDGVVGARTTGFILSLLDLALLTLTVESLVQLLSIGLSV